MTASATVLFARLSAKARVRHLQLAATIGELGNLQKAAAAVGMSQPAATHALAELESVLATPLFERHARGMRPTAVGDAVLPLVRQMLRSMQECAAVVASMGAGTTGTLRVGAIGAAVSGLLCRALPAFTTRHPEVVVDVSQLTPDELLLAAAQRTLDLAVCREPRVLPDGFEFVPLVADRYAVACSPRHPLAGRTDVGIGELARQTWIMPPPNTVAARDFHRLWEDAEATAAPAICWVTSRSTPLMWAMVEQRRLLAFIPYNTVRQWIEACVLAEIKGRWAEMPLPPLGAVVRVSERGRRGPLAAFVDELSRWSDWPGASPAQDG